MAKLFEYAILHHPTVKKDPAGNEVQGPSVIIVEPTHVLAKDEKEVGIRAARGIPDQYLDKLDEVEIIVRPF